jgi:four helix bundle protein
MGSGFRDLVAFRQAVALAEDMHAAVRRWPPFERDTIGKQLVRAADSVGANIAEAYGRWHRADQRRQLYIARGSVNETQYWIARAETEKLLPPGTTSRADEVGRTLNGLIAAHKTRSTRH